MARKKQVDSLPTTPHRPALSNTELALRREPRRPIWEPEGEALAAVPAEVQQMIHQILRPFYERFVTNARDALEQSLAMTLAHLMWLEILEQYDTKRLYAHIDMPLDLPGNHMARIEQHLRIIEGKVRVGYLLAYLRKCIDRCNGESIMPLPQTSPATPASVEEDSLMLLTIQSDPASDKPRRPAVRRHRATCPRQTANDDPTESDHPEAGQWQQIRQSLLGLLRDTCQQPDTKEHQAACRTP